MRVNFVIRERTYRAGLLNLELPIAVLAGELEWDLERRRGIQRAPGDTRTDIYFRWTEPATGDLTIERVPPPPSLGAAILVKG
jgi:hypothetical protein